MKSFDAIDIEFINRRMTKAMLNRGFISYNDDCLKLDLHPYFELNPVSIELQDNGFLAIKVKLKIYLLNQDIYISYVYKALIVSDGFRERHSFSPEYSFVLNIIRRLLHESGVYDYITHPKIY